MDVNQFIVEVAAVLTVRGYGYRDAELSAYVRAAWPTDSTPEAVADDWVADRHAWEAEMDCGPV